MPEGHSIHRLARRHTRLLRGRVVRASSPQGRFSAGAADLDGAPFDGAEAWGKHLFHDYGGRWLHVHLGLFGRFRDGLGEPPEPRGALRLRLTSDEVWIDLRGPTACEVIDDLARESLIARLGPDPLRPGSGPTQMLARVKRSRRPIGALLLDQSVVAGIGNVYRAEALFRQGLNPWLPGRQVDPTVLEALWDDLLPLMEAGVRTGRIVTTQPDDRMRPYGRVRRIDAHYVYGRAGHPCRRCGSEVHRDELEARAIFWCAICQA